MVSEPRFKGNGESRRTRGVPRVLNSTTPKPQQRSPRSRLAESGRRVRRLWRRRGSPDQRIRPQVRWRRLLPLQESSPRHRGRQRRAADRGRATCSGQPRTSGRRRGSARARRLPKPMPSPPVAVDPDRFRRPATPIRRPPSRRAFRQGTAVGPWAEVEQQR